RIMALMAATAFAVLLPIWSLPRAAGQGHGTFTNFQQIGCYFNPSDKRLWLAAIGLNKTYLDPNFYDDPAFAVILRAGDARFEIPGADVLVHVMQKFNFKDAAKYQFMKYSLIVDYSSSIPVSVRADILNFLDTFIGKLPLAVEGQVIRFNDKVEKFPFTSNKSDLVVQLRQPINYTTTALHDALMEGASSLIHHGPNTPAR